MNGQKQIRAAWTAALVVLLVLAAGCGGAQAAGSGGSSGGSGTHTLAEVDSAISAVGLTRFHAMPHSEFTHKHLPNIDPTKVQGGFLYSASDINRTPAALAFIIVVVADPSVFKPIQAENTRESKLPPRFPLHTKYASSGNVLVVSASSHPDAIQSTQLAKIPDLIAYLDAH